MKHSGSVVIEYKASDLFAISQTHFQSIIVALRAEGIAISPQLDVQVGDGLLCHYDSDSQTIFVCVPDIQTPYGQLQITLLRFLLDCESDDELLRFLDQIMRWSITLSIAHHARHEMGLLSENIWQEAQIANYLAIALCKPHFSSDARAWCDHILQRALHNLATKQFTTSSHIDSYHSLPHSLLVAGLIDARIFEHITRIRHQTGYLSEVILKNRLVDNLPHDIEQRVHNRHKIIKHINAGDYRYIVQDLYYMLGWLHIGLMSAEHYTVQGFKQHFLIGGDGFESASKPTSVARF